MDKACDVLLVNPGNLSAVYQQLGNSYSAVEPPSLLGLFASYIRNKGISVSIVDVPAVGMTSDDVVKRYVELDPVLVVVVVYGMQPSASTQNMPFASVICRALKTASPECKIMLTGTHPAALPERTMNEELTDFVCDGEGPETILLTTKKIKADQTDFSDVPNLWYRKEGVIVSTFPGKLITDLDTELPGVAWDLLPMERYTAHNWHCFDSIHERKPYISMHTSLGCPFKCSFCCINAPFGKPSYRRWSPAIVVAQIDHVVKKYGVRNIKFVDEMFVLHEKHVLGICDLLIERGYDLNIWAYARVDTIKSEYLEKLKRAGFRWLALGIESGSTHVRDGVAKGISGDHIISTVRMIQEAGIFVIGNYIFGLPDDTLDSMQETLDLAIEANCEFANIYCAMAYPGSKLYSLAIEKGWRLPDTWLGYSQHSYETFPLQTETLTPAQVLKFRDDAFMKYYTGERYLSMIKGKFGEEVVEHVKKMTSINLKRKLIDG